MAKGSNYSLCFLTEGKEEDQRAAPITFVVTATPIRTEINKNNNIPAKV